MMNDLKWAKGTRVCLCMYFVKHKKCTIPTCPFAHSIAAVKAANPFYKTGPCKEFQNGACSYGNFADVEGGHPTNWCGRIHLPLPQKCKYYVLAKIQSNFESQQTRGSQL